MVIAAVIVPRVMEQMNEEVAEEVIARITVAGEVAIVDDMVTYYDLIGNTYSNKSVPVMPSLPAEVISIDVEIGDFVNEGDVLFTLDPSNIEDQVTQAELGIEQANAAVSQANVGIRNANASIAQAELAYEMAKSNYEVNVANYNFSQANLAKYEELYKEGIVSEMEIEQMRLQSNPETLALLEQQLKQAEEALNQAKLGADQASSSYSQADVGLRQANEGLDTAADALEDSVVTAPVSGYITAQNLTEDVMASNTSIAMMIDELQTIKVTASVTANQVGNIKIGDEVQVAISANDKTYTGSVETVGLTADTRTMLYPITILIPNEQLEIKPGMFATIHMVDEAVSQAIIVPTEAVVIRDGKEVVFVYNGGETGVATEVTTGAEDGYRVQILSGINEGDVVITNGVGLIDDETFIEVVRGDE